MNRWNRVARWLKPRRDPAASAPLYNPRHAVSRPRLTKPEGTPSDGS